MPMIDSHPSVESVALEREAATSLRANRIDPKFLYVTPGQTELWRQVFLKHSPIHGNAEFSRIYREAFAQMAAHGVAKKIFLVGLGCGTGLKERDLAAQLRASGREVVFAAIDASRDLVAESAERLVATGAEHRRSLVCDLAQPEFIARWLDEVDGEVPRIITFFGLFPNFAPSTITRLFHSILRPGDVVLASAHLAPVRQEGADELARAMRAVLPQYDNAETLAWLDAAVQLWNLQLLVEPARMTIGEMEGVPAFLGTAHWKTGHSFERWGERFTPDAGGPLRLFYSLRYTPDLFEALLKKEGFVAQRLALTTCREEGIWAIRR